MIAYKPSSNIIHFEFDTHKEITTTFFRIQEYYESPLEGLVGKKFSVYDFLIESMDNMGNLNYFNFWTGFNFPDYILKEWIKLNPQKEWTPKEKELIDKIKEKVNWNEKFYVIGSLKTDKTAYRHEMAHAHYYTETLYKVDMDILTHRLLSKHKKQYQIIRKHLIKLGYNTKVIMDEIQAYLSTEPKKFLIEEFGINYEELSPLIKRYQKTFKQYREQSYELEVYQ